MCALRGKPIYRYFPLYLNNLLSFNRFHRNIHEIGLSQGLPTLLTFNMRTMRFNLFKISSVLDSFRTWEIRVFWRAVRLLEVPLKS